MLAASLVAPEEEEPRAAATAVRAPTGPWATPVERRWLRRLRAWIDDVELSLRRFDALQRDPARRVRLTQGDRAALRELAVAGDAVAQCDEALRDLVRPPPTARLRPNGALAVRTCVRYQRALLLSVQALVQRDDDVVAEAQAEFVAAHALNARMRALSLPGARQPLPIRGGASEASRIEPLLGRAASRVVRNRVEVRCWSPADWARLLGELTAVSGRRAAGTAAFVETRGSGRVQLSPELCARLGALAYDGRTLPRDRAGYALVTLAQEAFFASGDASGVVADCYGVQRAPEVARVLGVPAARARRAVEAHWARDELRRDPRCRNGSVLDLRPRDPRFP